MSSTRKVEKWVKDIAYSLVTLAEIKLQQQGLHSENSRNSY